MNIIQRLSLLSASSLLMVTSHAADMNAELTNFARDLGASANLTNPGAYQGQTASVYTGGNLTARVPAKSYSVSSFSPPSFKIGCGGIDAYGGSFSHINSAQLTAMFQNILSNAGPLFFKMALSNLSKDLNVNMEALNELASKVNLNNINSCEAAQSLVNGIGGALDMQTASGCQNIQQYLGKVADNAAAREACAAGPARTSTLQQASVSSDPEVKNISLTTNVVWDALSQTSLTKPERELLMSMTGTVIKTQGSVAPKLPVLKLDPLFDFDSGLTQASVDTYKCDSDQCLSPSVVTQTVNNFKTYAIVQMQAIRAALQGRKKVDNATRSFVATTSIPVHRMMHLAIKMGNKDDLTSIIIRDYAELVALDYARAYLDNGINVTREILQKVQTPNGAITEFKEALNNLLDQERRINQRYTELRRNAFEGRQLYAQLQQQEATMSARNPALLRFANSPAIARSQYITQRQQ
jgi:conjugative transfer pilus assembly protein TraH